MRTWRVGSISMGLSLLLLGVLLLFTQLFHLNIATVVLAWWPVILIVLGIEILLYLYLSKQENTSVKYDFLSIIFVGLIGMVGIGFTVLATTGITDKINMWTNIETSTMDLPEYEQSIGKDIKRVVVNTGSHSLTMEDSQHEGVSIFGTYHAQTVENEPAIEAVKDYLLIVEKGDTLYISFKEIYNLPQPFQDWIDLSATLLVPSNIMVEVNGKNNAVTLKPRSLANTWLVNDVSNVDVLLADKADILVKANNVDTLSGEEWVDTDESGDSSVLKFGAGAYTLTVNKAQTVSVTNP